MTVHYLNSVSNTDIPSRKNFPTYLEVKVYLDFSHPVLRFSIIFSASLFHSLLLLENNNYTARQKHKKLLKQQYCKKMLTTSQRSKKKDEKHKNLLDNFATDFNFLTFFECLKMSYSKCSSFSSKAEIITYISRRKNRKKQDFP